MGAFSNLQELYWRLTKIAPRLCRVSTPAFTLLALNTDPDTQEPVHAKTLKSACSSLRRCTIDVIVKKLMLDC